jgi:hypothetical protein
LNTAGAALTNGATTASDNKYYTGDNVSLDATGATGSFADRHAGIGKSVAVSGLLLAGADKDNYTITGASGTTATISPKSLTASYTGSNKTYDGNTNATVTGTSADIIGGDTVSFSQTALFDTKDVGTGKAIGITGITLGGLDGGNYGLTGTTASATADITRAPLLITANGVTKTYDGSAYTGGSGVTYTGLAGGETSSVLGGTLNYGGSSQGAVNLGNYLISPFGLTSGNYSITFADGTLRIVPAESTGGYALSGALADAYAGALMSMYQAGDNDRKETLMGARNNGNGPLFNIIGTGIRLPGDEIALFP